MDEITDATEVTISMELAGRILAKLDDCGAMQEYMDLIWAAIVPPEPAPTEEDR